MRTIKHQFISNLLLSGWLLSDVVRGVSYITLSKEEVPELFIMIAFSLQAWFALRRPIPFSGPSNFMEYLVPILATIYPYSFLCIPSVTDQNLPALSLQYTGAVGMIFSSISLGDRFAVFPQCRGLSKSGAYSCVRHPLYSSYLIYDFTFIILYPRFITVLLYLVEVVLLLIRAIIEERHLFKFSDDYAEYKHSVRYRFIPFLI